MAEPMPLTSTTQPRSRRALLTGALGGIGALAATVIGGAARTQAAAGSPLIIGSSTNNAGTSNTILTTSSTVTAFQLIQNGGGTSLMGYVTPATGPTRGVYGRSNSSNGDGVQARNAGIAGTGAAVRAFGGNNTGVDATTDNADRYAVRGVNNDSGTGIIGSTTGGHAVEGIATDGTGVFGETSTGGFAVFGTSTDGIGVYGSSSNFYGVYGTSTSSYAGYFNGRVAVNSSYVDVISMTAPSNPPANTARVFARVIAEKTELCVIFPSGDVHVIAAEA